MTTVLIINTIQIQIKLNSFHNQQSSTSMVEVLQNASQQLWKHRQYIQLKVTATKMKKMQIEIK
jgi:competence transcription factor ComK